MELRGESHLFWKNSLCRQAALILAPVLIVLGGATFLLYSLNAAKHEQVLRERAMNSVHVAKHLLSQRLQDITSDLEYLANVHEAAYIVSGLVSPETTESLALFSQAKKVYDQIRYLDITGMELCRVDRVGDYGIVVPSDRLQFKGDRYYAAEGLTLTKGEIYISPLDLNKERGKIEIPHKPMLRFVTPVYDARDRREGIVVLNYLGATLLEPLDELASDGNIMLLNQDGYWLRGGTQRQNWAFMFKDRKQVTFGAAHPEEWKRMQQTQDGQFITAKGLYTFTSMCLGDSIHKYREERTVRDAGCWTIVSHVPPEALHEGSRAFLAKLAMFNVPIILLVAGVVVLLCRQRLKTKEAQLSIIEQNASFARFVPGEFLTLLGKGSLSDVELSTSVQRKVAVLFSDIRSYTKLSEGMTPEQIFHLLNDYFVFASEPIEENGGFIDVFIGDALMALFPDGPEGALRAAISMRRELRVFNDERRASGVKPVHAGYGLHFGEATLGTIGSPKRMQTTAIGDTVNLAARIESATKMYKAEIILSDTVYGLLPDPGTFRLRHIDTVRVKGKQEPVALYEAFDADPPEVAQGKEATLEQFNEAMGHYKAGRFQEALDLFSACAEACPEDGVPPLYVKRCGTMSRIPPGPEWTGISTL